MVGFYTKETVYNADKVYRNGERLNHLSDFSEALWPNPVVGSDNTFNVEFLYYLFIKNKLNNL